MADTMLVSISVTSNQALTDEMKAKLESLQGAFAGQDRIEVADVPLEGMGSIDPDALKFVLDLMQKGGEIVATVAAKEVCTWLWSRIRSLRSDARPSSITMTIGQTGIDIPVNPTQEQIQSTIQIAEAAIRVAAAARAARPGP